MSKREGVRLGTKAEMSEPSGQYDVFCTQGQGGSIDASYKTLGEALAHVKEHDGEGAFAIRYPHGEWHKWRGAGEDCKDDIPPEGEGGGF